MNYDCIIIGAGMSGLAAGIRLAHFGKKVCILEKHSRSGGLNSYYFRQGVEIDTGLHAMTNFMPRDGSKNAPLMKLLRQLRIPYENLSLCEQNYSLIQFPSTSLRFSNDFNMLESEISDKFPYEIDNFRNLCAAIMKYDELDVNTPYISARNILKEYIRDDLLIEMLFCPLMFYGSAVEKDMDFSQFAIMFKSIFKEGFCRPEKGIRHLIELLESRFVSSGGELIHNCEVRKINSHNGIISNIETSGNQTITCSNLLSSAGNIETLKLCVDKPANFADLPSGQLSFIEAVFCFKPELALIDTDYSIKFFNLSEKFNYTRPKEIISMESGVFCCPFNFKYNEHPAEKIFRLTMLANHELWEKTDRSSYLAKKTELSDKLLEKCEVLSCISGLSDKLIFSDIFTPNTITRYTGHINGAVYGSPLKVKTGKTSFENLYLCGTDQGFLGITGSMLSGISIANMYLLR